MRTKGRERNKSKIYQISKKKDIQQNDRIFTIGNVILFFIINCVIFIPIYLNGIVDTRGYDKDLERRIPFVKKELIVYGRYDKNVVGFETNYGNKFNYYFPENTPIENIAKFTKENVGQIIEIKIENIQSAYLNVFNIKVQ